MGWASCSLQTGMGLEVKIEVIDSRNTPIDDSPWCGVPEPIRFVCFRWVETCVVSLSYNYDGNFGSVGVPKSCTCLPDQWKFIFNHGLELPCRNRIIRSFYNNETKEK